MKILPALALLFGSAPLAQGTLSISVAPPVFGLGDSGVVTVIGDPGDFAFLLTSLTPGPMQLPIVGQVEVGMDGLDYVVFGALPSSGVAQFFCTLPCIVTTPVYMQAVSIKGSPLVLAGKSPQLILGVDPTIIDDCDGNGVDDDCDVQGGVVPDCNGNGFPDSCDIASGRSLDTDGDGVPDECCDDICSMQARYTIDGPLMAPPFLLTIRIVAPGLSSPTSEILYDVTSTSLPTTLSSPDGVLTASEFAFTPTGGLSFVVTYTPTTPSAFGTNVILVGEAEGHCERLSIGSGLRSRCDLFVGMLFSSTADAGQFEILAIEETCP